MTRLERDFYEVLHGTLHENIITDTAKNVWDATGGKVVNKVVDTAKGVAGTAALGGAMYAGAKAAEKDQENKQENQGEKQITDIGLSLDKQKYAQMAKLYNADANMKKALPGETKIINDINSILKTFNP